MTVINSNKMDFSNVIRDYLRQYDGTAIEALTATITEVAKESVKKLKADSPRGKTGEYSKNWKYEVERGRLKVGATVYGGKPTYRLAHLLEHGHAKRGGGRVEGITHIAPVEEWATEEVVNRYIDKMEEAIE